jgi:uncharacterized protein CbrC (UPF0167 family)
MMNELEYDTDRTETPAAAPKKPVKKAKKKRAFPRMRIEEKAATKVPSQFSGISANECCDGCNKDGCVISGSFYCAHPMKGGLQAEQMNDPEALKRFARAKAALKDQMIDLRNR